MSASILFVCTGNICRSPFAAVYLQSSLNDLPGISVSSAGTYAADSDPMTPEMAERTARFGVDGSKHRSRYLIEPFIESADLNLALTRSHRGEIVKLVPRKLIVTFTLREFARLGDSASDEEIVEAGRSGATDGERIKSVARLLHTRRSRFDPEMTADADDVVDPYRGDDELYDRSIDQMVPALESTARVLRLALAP